MVMGTVDLSVFEAVRVGGEILLIVVALSASGRALFKRLSRILENQTRHESKIDGINDRLDTQNGRVGKLEQKAAEHEGMLKAILATKETHAP